MISDKSIEFLQAKSNLELKKIDAWLCQNKLSLNYPRTNFMVINKYPHKSINVSFNLDLNGSPIALKRVETYLGISIDETLTWTAHITQLTYSSPNMLAFFTDCVVMLLVKPSVCYIIPWFAARYNMELLLEQQLIKHILKLLKLN